MRHSLLKKQTVNVRYADEKGEMPLHKFARLKLKDEKSVQEQQRQKQIFKDLVALIRLQCEKAEHCGKPYLTSLGSDVNHQDKQGKTPLYLAIEHKNTAYIDMLYSLRNDGPDTVCQSARPPSPPRRRPLHGVPC